MHGADRHGRSGLAAAAAALAIAQPAAAQVSGGATIATEYRYRGFPTSEARPAAVLNLTYDHPRGFYAGATLLAQGAPDGPRSLGRIVYAGYARRLRGGAALDFGAINYRFTPYGKGRREAGSSEAYVGLVGDRAAAHLYYSADDYRTGGRALYLDLEGSVLATERWRTFGHAGLLVPAGARRGGGAGEARFDLKVGVAAQVRDVELSLAWTHLSPSRAYASDERQGGDAMIAAASVYF